MGFAAIIGATGASTLVTRFGTRPVHLGGAVLSVAGLVLLAQVDAADSYATDILPGLLLFGFGLMGIAVANQIMAVADVRDEEAGAASGLVTAGYQVGGALGLSIITTLSQRGLLVAAVFAAINIAVTFASPQRRPGSEQLSEAAAVA
jgi:predicted MFS family arabinose efflux permease